MAKKIEVIDEYVDVMELPNLVPDDFLRRMNDALDSGTARQRQGGLEGEKALRQAALEMMCFMHVEWRLTLGLT